MNAYASRTGTRRNLAALRRAGWHLLVSATGALRHEGFPYALDSGAWSAYQQGRPFDVFAYEKALAWAAGQIVQPDWIVLPDIVGGGKISLAMSLGWIDRVPRNKLIAVQDGMEPGDVKPHLGSDVGLFLGGTTDWKIATMGAWGRLAREVGCYYHVARVNTRRRIKQAAMAGAHSFDGTSVTKFAVTIHHLDAERRQRVFRWTA